MHGMFRGNGGCGYVKKPEILMKQAPHEVFDPRASLPEKKTLKVSTTFWSLGTEQIMACFRIFYDILPRNKH